MATGPRIRYDIEARAAGAADVEKLAQEFQKLDGAFPDTLSDKVRQASATLGELGKQQAAIDAFTRISAQAELAKQSLENAQAAAQKFNEKISASGPPTAAQSAQLGKLNDQVKSASDAFTRQSESLSKAASGLREFGISENQLKQVSAELASQVGKTTETLQRLVSTGGSATGFQQLVRETDAARQRMQETARAAEQLAAELQGVQRPTDGEAAKLRELRAAADTARADFERLQQTTVEQGLALRQAGVNTELLTAKTREAAAAQQQASAAAQRGANAYTEQGAAAQRAATQQTAAATNVRQGLEGIAGQLRSIQALAATVLGGQLLSGTIGDIARTADAYSNLEGRIKLVTGEGAALRQAFDGVFDVALRTNSAVEGTGTLFARIAQASKDLGLSTSEASAQALQLTETINQAIQVSGGTAQAADAAVTQLIQALQSGVLRGEEFNSVMEQAPRLARALADGLGVTTGELRKLAEAGTLTSQTVINALRGQSEALQREFEQLPPTVGRALQTLSVEWTRYVGEVDRANGVSRSAAEAITSLARNLDTVGTALAVAGKAAAAYLAIDLAKSLYSRAAAAAAAAAAQQTETAAVSSSTAALGTNTAALGANTAAKAANTAATAANSAANAAGALAWGSVERNVRLGGAAAAEAATKTGALGTAFGLARGAGSALLGAIGGLPTVLLGVALNAREIGTWLGESAAKMLGAKDRSEELAKADAELARRSREVAAAKAAQAQAAQLAADKALGLTDASKRLVGEFDGLVKKGESVSEALAKVAKDLELDNLTGIRDAITALDALAQQGKITGQQVREALAGALKGEDLAVFRIQARAAFDESEQGARRFAAAVAAIDAEALRRAGTSIEELRTGFSQAANSAINDVAALNDAINRLGLAGEDAQRAVARSLDAATQAAGTQRAVEDLIGRIAQLGEEGALSGKRLEDAFVKAIDKAVEFGETDRDLRKVEQAIKDIIAANPQMAAAFEGSLDKLKQKVVEVTPYLRQLQADARQLGVQLEDSTSKGVTASIQAYERLKASGKLSTSELQQAFGNLAAQLIKQSNGQVSDWLKVEAQMRNVRIEVDANGKAAIDFGNAASGAFNQAAGSLSGIGSALDQLNSKLTQTAASLSSVYDAATKARKAADLSVLGNVDSSGFTLGPDGQRFTVSRQIDVPDGYTFDNAAFQRAQRNAALTGGPAPDPANFYVAPSPGLLEITDESAAEQGLIRNGSAGYSPLGANRQQAELQRRAAEADRIARQNAAARAAASGATTTNVQIVRLQIGSSSTDVRVSSAADASALTSFMDQLAAAARSAGINISG
ncbi:tape measure protein [Piscinibacter defluvii]|uniref:tape measure protein n=1 Tax=Piscinibacter defluvii TaxID=1796922 RepID=UPI000FDECF46|nr:tape measure protein [Piscinibacter defluvii]